MRYWTTITFSPSFSQIFSHCRHCPHHLPPFPSHFHQFSINFIMFSAIFTQKSHIFNSFHQHVPHFFHDGADKWRPPPAPPRPRASRLATTAPSRRWAAPGCAARCCTAQRPCGGVATWRGRRRGQWRSHPEMSCGTWNGEIRANWGLPSGKLT